MLEEGGGGGDLLMGVAVAGVALAPRLRTGVASGVAAGVLSEVTGEDVAGSRFAASRREKREVIASPFNARRYFPRCFSRLRPAIFVRAAPPRKK